MLEIAIAIAREAGALLRDGFRRERTYRFKSRAELVTAMDRASEQLIVERLAAHFPDHTIIAEEGSRYAGSPRAVWLVDPLDGTNNYARGIAYWAVSLALLLDERPVLGVVYDPIHDECFTAEAEGPALLNGTPLHVSACADLSQAQLSTGFPYRRWEHGDTNLPEVAAMVMACQDLRRMGAAALDLCAVAAGRSEGHWELRIAPWDGAAGALIVQRAGGMVTDLTGAAYTPWQPPIVASNGLIHDALLQILGAARNAS
ncbi:inositol monophosphatase family protein [Kallotenue papyrolyticum]|uniref:inositol monophosphatase family protein n=1 Tax=Kallotenue papyrolyticum TaxID=1325125 RepID=UPI0004785F5A|nr:inositol monophosphatase family protein [Kallotenue papyrolyticum]